MLEGRRTRKSRSLLTGPRPNPEVPQRRPLSPTAPPPVDHYMRCAYAPLACPDAPKFPEISKKMSTWHIRDWPLSRGHGGPYPIVCSFEKGSNVGKTWTSLPINKEERDRNGHKELDVYYQREGRSLDMRTKLRSKFPLLFIVCAALLAVGGTAMALTTDTSGSTSPSPTISSDKADYSPGELVTLTGSGWQAGESVHIVVNDDEGQTWKRDVYVDADASGNISDSFNLPDWFVATYTVTATGTQSGVATTTFTDGTVRVRAVGTAGTQPTLNWELYNNTTCTGTASNSGSIAAVGLAANGSDIPVNVNTTQSLKLTPGSVPGHTFVKWTSGNFTTGTFTDTSNPGCIVGTGSGISGGGAQNTQVNYNNAAPVVANQTVSTNVNTAKLITLGATDANNDTLTYEFVGPLPANGTLYKGDATNPTNQTNANKITGSTTLTGTAQVTYVPDNGFTGTNTFRFQATDQSATSTTATVTINVTSCTTPAAPVFATKSTDADGSNGWFRTIPTVSASSTSAGATITYATEVNGGTKSAYSATAPNLGQGTTKVYAKATNGTCTSETPDTFKVDTIAPAISPGDVVNNAWRNSPLGPLSFTATDGGSGLAPNQNLGAGGGFTLTASDESADADTPTVVSKTVSDVAGNSTTRSVGQDRQDRSDDHGFCGPCGQRQRLVQR